MLLTMRTFRLFLLSIVLCSSQIQAFPPDDSGIIFEHGTFTEILAKAKKSKKIIFIDAYTTWCGPCKYMAKNIFTQPEVGKFYNQNFVCAKIDMESGEGKALSQKYEVGAYPTFLFVDGEGNLVHRVCGSSEAEGFIQSGKDALNPTVQFAAVKKAYEKTPQNINAVKAYLSAMESSCMQGADELAAKFFTTLSEKDKLSTSNWDFISQYGKNPVSPVFAWVESNKDKLGQMHTTDTVNMVLFRGYAGLVETELRKETLNENALNAAKNKMLSVTRPEEKEKLSLTIEMYVEEKKQDFESLAKSAIRFVDTYADNAETYNQYAWLFQEKFPGDQIRLKKAEEWVKKSIELEEQYANLDTYAWVLFRQKKYKEALPVAEKAQKTGDDSGEDTTTTKELISQIKELLGAKK